MSCPRPRSAKWLVGDLAIPWLSPAAWLLAAGKQLSCLPGRLLQAASPTVVPSTSPGRAPWTVLLGSDSQLERREDRPGRSTLRLCAGLWSLGLGGARLARLEGVSLGSWVPTVGSGVNCWHHQSRRFVAGNREGHGSSTGSCLLVWRPGPLVCGVRPWLQVALLRRHRVPAIDI